MVKHSIVGLLSKIAAAFLAFGSNLLIARFLGADASGYYYYLISFTGISVAFTVLGGHTYLLKAVPTFPPRENVIGSRMIISSLMLRTILIAAVTVSAAYVIVAALPEVVPTLLSENPAFPYILVSVPFLALNVLLSHVLQIRRKILLAFLTSGLTHSAGLALSLVVFRPSGPDTLSLIYLFVTLGVFTHLLLLNRRVFSLRVPVKSIDLAGVTAGSYPFFLIQMGLELLVQSPVLLLGAFSASSSDVSGYAISWRVAVTLGFIYSVVNRLVLPRFSSLYADALWAELRTEFIWSVLLMCAVTIPLAISLVFFSSDILNIFGEEFASYQLTFCVLVSLQCLNVVTGPAGNFLMIVDRQSTFRWIVVGGLALVLISCVVLIPRFGALGASVSVALAYGFVNVASLVLAIRLLVGHGAHRA